MHIFRQIYRLSRLCLSGEGAKLSGFLLALIIALDLAGIYFSIRMISWTADFYNALEKIDSAAVISQIGIFALIVSCNSARSLIGSYYQKVLEIRWREVLTGKALDLWFTNKAYWHLTQGEYLREVDNPDQRIADDCKLFVRGFLSEGIDLIGRVAGLFSYLVLLWGLSTFALSFSLFGFDITIPRYMVWAVFIYVGLSTILTYSLGKPMKKLFEAQQKREADFRFSLARLRQSTEEVALLRGENAERDLLDRRFDNVRANWRNLIIREFWLGCFTTPYQFTILRIPMFVALPAYLAKSVTLGGLMQVAGAFSSVATTLSWFVFYYKRLADLAATAGRLDVFLNAAQHAAQYRSGINHSANSDETLHIEDLQLTTPNGQLLLQLGKLSIKKGETIWLRAPSGFGKSTFYRALAGFWPHGSGTINAGLKNALFLPQKPYFPQTDLYTAISYPHPVTDFAQTDLDEALAAVGLGNGHTKSPEPDTQAPPHMVANLSGGELQRLSLARAFVQKPDWLFLDEATCSLDKQTENHLLHLLREHLPQSAIIIIAHADMQSTLNPRVINLDILPVPASAAA
ncbi:SbmA/BacA-like family transporter [Pseudochrobactrum sp. sp1633]|uniref:ABC transporter ATP-binding protein/permease n=1 Tax=Pseudochrobactrum sp. sp1633 TaxID=3036706 RepID=UPI0025A5A003|nr:SbmA/BacA-like family transporter [Pseudochrobactrum sp. sp1633]MDM8346853.1 SbmA/BacA-like family transporter [Pseudochrobactrum sp. sp1633]HWD12574.1 SbmA/BacA-like family transporter [Pseudochrobactrum sp.]